MSRKYTAAQFAPPNGGIVECQLPNTSVLGYFAGVPTASVTGYHPGAIAVDITNGNLYRNSGTIAAATWVQFNAGTDLSGLTATAAEINRSSKNSTRPVTAAGTLTVTQDLHDGKTVLMPAACAITLPASTGSGARYRFAQQVAATAVTITATGAHMFGNSWVFSDNAAQAVIGWIAAGSTVITFNGSTQGGLKGATVEIEDAATGFLVTRVMTSATGVEATPFS